MQLGNNSQLLDEIIKQQRDDKISIGGYKLIAYIIPVGALSEGSKVLLDGSQSYYKSFNDTSFPQLTSITTTGGIGESDGVTYLWNQIGGPKVDLIDIYTPAETDKQRRDSNQGEYT